MVAYLLALKDGAKFVFYSIFREATVQFSVTIFL